MKPFLNSMVVAFFLTAGVIGVLEARQVSQLRERIHWLRQEQTALAGQIRQLEEEHNETMKHMAGLEEESELLETNSNWLELLKLRGEATQLETSEAGRENDPIAAAEDAWLARVQQLKRYVEQHPDAAIPELQYLSAREWLIVMASSNTTNLAQAMGELKIQAQGKFANAVGDALKEYTEANNGQFPDDLSQLQPYGDADMEEILQQRYEIEPVSELNRRTIQFAGLKSDHIIASRFTLGNGSSSHVAVYPGGYAYF